MGIGAGLYMYDVVVKKFTFAISSPDEFLSWLVMTFTLMLLFGSVDFSSVLHSLSGVTKM